MEGVEILSVGEQAVFGGFNWSGAFIVLAGVGSIIAILSYISDRKIIRALVCGLMFGGCFGMMTGFKSPPKIDSIPIYKVTIADTVNFNEFTEKYDIIEQDGKIYIVKEREEN